LRLRIPSLLAILLFISLSFIPFSQGTTSAAAVFSTSGIISYSETPETARKPYVDGIMIKDPSGLPIRLRGFNFEPRDVAITGGYAEFVQWLKNNGFNNLRVIVWWHQFEPNEGQYSSGYFGYLDDLMNNCEQMDVYVNLCFAQWQYSPYFTYDAQRGSGMGFPAWLISAGGYENSASGAQAFTSDFYLNRGYGVTARQKYLGFWQYLINRYKSYSCIWAYELMNEPTVISGFTWTSEALAGIMTFYEQLTPAIRSLDPNPTIILYHYITGTVASQGNLFYERPVNFSNIVWTRSWYDVAYGGYSPSERPQVVTRLTNLKNAFNGQLGTPFIISEMGISTSDYNTNPSGAEKWIRDTFDVCRSIGMNNGYEGWTWYIYYKDNPATGRHGYTIPRDALGNNTWMVPAFQEYF
jgi:hypothetical protein